MTTTTDNPKMERLIRVIRGLQAKAESTSYEEAIACQGKVQELMEVHGITTMMLEQASETEAKANAPAEIISKTIYRHGDKPSRRMPTWLLNLSSGVANANRCKYWYSGNAIRAAGTEENLLKMELMLCWLVGEMSRLYEEERPTYKMQEYHPTLGKLSKPRRVPLSRAEGREWANSFRLGCANKMSERAKEARREAKKAALDNTPEKQYERAIREGDQTKLLELDKLGVKIGDEKYALARVNYAIARLDEDEKRTQDHYKNVIAVRVCHHCNGTQILPSGNPCGRCKGGKVSSMGKGSQRDWYGSNSQAFSKGVQAGSRANMNAPKGQIQG